MSLATLDQPAVAHIHIVKAANIRLCVVFLTATTTMVGTALSIDMDAPDALYSNTLVSDSVKVEPASFELGHSLLHSPPSSRSSSRASYPNASSSRFRRKLTHSSSRGELSIMTHPYGVWSPSALKNEQSPGHRGSSDVAQSSGASRRSGSGDQQPFYSQDNYSQLVSCHAIRSQLRLIRI